MPIYIYSQDQNDPKFEDEINNQIPDTVSSVDPGELNAVSIEVDATSKDDLDFYMEQQGYSYLHTASVVLTGNHHWGSFTTANEPTTSLTAGDTGFNTDLNSSVYYNGSDWVEYVIKDADGNVNLAGSITANVNADLALRTGFVNLTDSVLSADDATLTLTITPVGSFRIYQANLARDYTTPQEATWTDTEGKHFIYFNDSGVLVSTTTFDARMILGPWALAAIVYWDATNKETIFIDECFDERHGAIMDGATHLWQHQNIGCVIVSNIGLALGGFDIDGTGDLDSEAQFGYTGATIADEDIQLPVTAKASTVGNQVVYFVGTTPDQRSEFNSGFSILTTGTGRAAYNLNTGGTWSLAEVANNQYFLYHIWTTTSNTDVNRVFATPGIDTYGNPTAARDAAHTEIQLVKPNLLLFNELKEIGTVICQTSDSMLNAVKSRIITTDTGADYIDWRAGVAIDAVAATIDHQGLTNRDVLGAHPASSLTADLSKADLYVSTPVATASITPGTAINICGNSTTAAGGITAVDFTVSASGRLTYIGIPILEFDVFAIVSINTGTVNRNVSFFVAKNGVAISGSEQQRGVGTGGYVGGQSTGWNVELATNDYVEIFVDADLATTVTPTNLYMKVTQQL